MITATAMPGSARWGAGAGLARTRPTFSARDLESLGAHETLTREFVTRFGTGAVPLTWVVVSWLFASKAVRSGETVRSCMARTLLSPDQRKIWRAAEDAAHETMAQAFLETFPPCSPATEPAERNARRNRIFDRFDHQLVQAFLAALREPAPQTLNTSNIRTALTWPELSATLPKPWGCSAGGNSPTSATST